MSTGEGVPDRKGGRGQLQKGMERRLLVKGVTYVPDWCWKDLSGCSAETGAWRVGAGAGARAYCTVQEGSRKTKEPYLFSSPED